MLRMTRYSFFEEGCKGESKKKKNLINNVKIHISLKGKIHSSHGLNFILLQVMKSKKSLV